MSDKEGAQALPAPARLLAEVTDSLLLEWHPAWPASGHLQEQTQDPFDVPLSWTLLIEELRREGPSTPEPSPVPKRMLH